MRVRVAPVVVGAVLVITGCAVEDGVVPAAGETAGAVVTQDVDATAPAEGAGPTLCAEFPAVGSLPGDVEGWWSSSPADENANVLTDPADWPDEMREHPRVALVAVDAATVISTWDRVACGPDRDYVPEIAADWPAGHLVAVDMDSGELLQDLGPER